MYRQRYPDDPGMNNPQGNTRVSYRHNPGFLERIQKSLAGIFIGLVLIVVSSGLLFWNEGRAVQTAQSLDEGLKVVIPLGTIDVAFDNNNGHLVFLQGQFQTDKALSDPVYGVSVSAVKLRRTVEMYQWVEHESRREINEGDSTREETEYSYLEEWRGDFVPSNKFYRSLGHENPSSMPVTSQTFSANSVRVGAFHLSNGLVDQIKDFTDISPSTGVTPSDPALKYHGEYYVTSEKPSRPKIGDIRVKFQSAGLTVNSEIGSPADVSIIARQQSNRLESYRTQAGDELEMLYVGVLSAQEIFAKAHSDNAMLTWGLRCGGWFLMFIGFGCLTSIVTTLVDWIPIVRELVSLGMGTMNAAFSISLSLTIIALGWIRYRPWLGMSILALAFTPLVFTKLRNMFGPPSNTRHRRV